MYGLEVPPCQPTLLIGQQWNPSLTSWMESFVLMCMAMYVYMYVHTHCMFTRKQYE